MKTETMRGRWKIPSHEEEITGRLYLSPEDPPRLELDGAFENPFRRGEPPDLIQGVTSTGERVSLLWCQTAGGSFNIGGGGPATATYSAGVAVVGFLFESIAAARFSRLGFRLEGAGEWARRSGFTHRIYDRRSGNSAGPVFELSYTFPEPISVQLPDGALDLVCEVTQTPTFTGKWEFLEKHYFVFDPPTPEGLDQLLEGPLRAVQQFLTLAIGQPVYPIEIFGIVDSALCAGDSSDNQRRVSVYFPSKRTKRSRDRIHPAYMLFTRDTLGEYYAEALGRWFGLRADVAASFNLYFSVLFAQEMYLEGRFLNLTQALEVFHRRRRGGLYVSGEAYDELRRQLEAQIRAVIASDRDARDAFIQRLAYWNEWSLRRRIKDAVGECGPWIADLIPDRNGFANYVVNTRNYLTHFDRSLEGSAASGSKLYRLSEQVRLLVEAMYLKELGLPDDRVGELLRNSERFGKLSRTATG